MHVLQNGADQVQMACLRDIKCVGIHQATPAKSDGCNKLTVTVMQVKSKPAAVADKSYTCHVHLKIGLHGDN